MRRRQSRQLVDRVDFPQSAWQRTLDGRLAGWAAATASCCETCALRTSPILLTTTSCRSHFTMGYEDSVYLAKLAEQAERYEGKLNSGLLREHAS